jgi:hypothetical protein
MTITEATRRSIFDYLQSCGVSWSGRLDEVEFLSRLYDLTAMPSTDHRREFRTAERDIRQHRVRNCDWDNGWIFSDGRFNLMRCDDEALLRFLCETIHPIVRSNADEVDALKNAFNHYLVDDGWEIHAQGELSGRPVFAARRLVTQAPGIKAIRDVTIVLDAAYLSTQTTRMESAIENDIELAIGTAKEFIETICKTILTDLGVQFDRSQELPKLVKQTMKELKLVPDGIPDQAQAAESIRVLLSNLASVAGRMAEIRNSYGTGHGKEAGANGLGRRHARLAVGAASTLGVFLFETHQDRQEAGA